ncbi:MAG TPA: S-methyl-5-thioribose-1-phosphate isomerase [Syntrophomonas sp.]|jgi:methylthioribose-1-phosphate isomerase|nr:S-methyl-5-thioribose-1-phosphate isomerase [Syntrophomonas sp.]
MIQTLYFENDDVIILDQSRLPDEVVYLRCQSPEEVAEAIKRLQVRGAPLIGVTAVFGLVMAVRKYTGPEHELPAYMEQVAALMCSTRPTAVNLFWAIRHIKSLFYDHWSEGREKTVAWLRDEAERMFAADVTINKAIGEKGQQLLKPATRIMTICNAGALATCGYGTALGVIRAASEQKKIKQVYACETRPVLQGARLTVWELMQDNIPVTLITDNMAGYVMSRGMVDAVIAGADRIAANGDTANKIGTYGLAVLARYHHIPFYIAAPLSTFDNEIHSGQEIPIEERHPEEVLQLGGKLITVPEVNVFNPAFDVTPGSLITAIITEKGIIRPAQN